MNNNKMRHLAQSAIIAALYVALTWISNIFGLASLAVQVRLGEALCILPFYNPSAIPGLFIGCLISNLTMGSTPLDIIVGSLATLAGAFFASKIKNKWLCPLPTVISNTIFIPLVIMLSYIVEWDNTAYLLTVLGVFAGEMVSAYALGMLLVFAIEKRPSLKYYLR